MSVVVSDFGEMRDGRKLSLYTMSNRKGMQVSALLW